MTERDAKSTTVWIIRAVMYVVYAFFIVSLLILLQGFAESVRCVVSLRTGSWPARLHDVQETETMLMHEQEELREAGKR